MTKLRLTGPSRAFEQLLQSRGRSRAQIPSAAFFYTSMTLYSVEMRIDNCPKGLNHCPEASCPIYPCWAYDQHLDKMDKEKQLKDDGWE